MSALVDNLFAPLVAVVSPEPVFARGSWSTSRRKTYASASQLGTCEGPYVEVIDSVWGGALESVVPLAGIATPRRRSGEGRRLRERSTAPSSLECPSRRTRSSVASERKPR